MGPDVDEMGEGNLASFFRGSRARTLSAINRAAAVSEELTSPLCLEHQNMKTPRCVAMTAPLVLLLWLAVGCVQPPVTAGVDLQGACATDADCPETTVCHNNSCVPDLIGGDASSVDTPASDSVECQTCTRDSDCGDGQNAGCWLLNQNDVPGFCAQDCTGTPNSCPQGSSCVRDANDPYSTCVPTSGSCSSGNTGTGGSGGGSTGGTTSGGSGGGSSGSDTCSSLTDTWSNYARSFFTSRCSGCHGWATSYSTVSSARSTIASRIQSGSMPPGGLSVSEKQRIVTWLQCGAPQ